VESGEKIIFRIIFYINELPVSHKELNEIIQSIRYKRPDLYTKLWAHKINVLNGDKK
jgi:hypothetical protein